MMTDRSKAWERGLIAAIERASIVDCIEWAVHDFQVIHRCSPTIIYVQPAVYDAIIRQIAEMWGKDGEMLRDTTMLRLNSLRDVPILRGAVGSDPVGTYLYLLNKPENKVHIV